jgi:hypothetical protein
MAVMLLPQTPHTNRPPDRVRLGRPCPFEPAVAKVKLRVFRVEVGQLLPARQFDLLAAFVFQALGHAATKLLEPIPHGRLFPLNHHRGGQPIKQSGEGFKTRFVGNGRPEPGADAKADPRSDIAR